MKFCLMSWFYKKKKITMMDQVSEEIKSPMDVDEQTIKKKN